MNMPRRISVFVVVFMLLTVQLSPLLSYGASSVYIPGVGGGSNPHGNATLLAGQSGLWTVPAGVNTIYVTMWGGGGSGAQNYPYCPNYYLAAGGTGAGAIVDYGLSVSPGQTISYSVGFGGAAVGNNSTYLVTGNPGGNTTFGNLVAYGGSGGITIYDANSPIPGGNATDGNTTAMGGSSGSNSSANGQVINNAVMNNGVLVGGTLYDGGGSCGDCNGYLGVTNGGFCDNEGDGGGGGSYGLGGSGAQNAGGQAGVNGGGGGAACGYFTSGAGGNGQIQIQW